jgi:hypothetical protein
LFANHPHQKRADDLCGAEPLLFCDSFDFRADILGHSDAECFHQVRLCGERTNTSTKKSLSSKKMLRSHRMKPKQTFSIRLPESVIYELDRMAAELGSLGTTRNNLVEQACVWYVRIWNANGNRPLTESDIRNLEEHLRKTFAKPQNIVADDDLRAVAETPSPISELPVPGSSQVRSVVRYPKGTRRKS